MRVKIDPYLLAYTTLIHPPTGNVVFKLGGPTVEITLTDAYDPQKISVIIVDKDELRKLLSLL